MEGLDGPGVQGELVRVTAHLHNAGSLPLRTLRLLIRQPDLLCCASPAHLTTKLTSLAGAARHSVHTLGHWALEKESD